LEGVFIFLEPVLGTDCFIFMNEFPRYCGVYNSDGIDISPAQYDSMRGHVSGLVIVQQDELYGLCRLEKYECEEGHDWRVAVEVACEYTSVVEYSLTECIYFTKDGSVSSYFYGKEVKPDYYSSAFWVSFFGEAKELRQGAIAKRLGWVVNSYALSSILKKAVRLGVLHKREDGNYFIA